MSNAEHLALIKQGVATWNAWRQENPEVRANLFRADLEGMYLAGANLSKVDLRRARLGRAFLRSANLSEAYLLGADLSQADLHQALLCKAILRDANLTGADLSHANLTEAYLSEANLSHAILVDVQLDRTLLTGACIENWQIDNPTQLDRAICDYIYLKPNQQECRPRLGSFGIGELVNLCQRTLDILEVSFDAGLDWSACLGSLREIHDLPGFGHVKLRSLEQSEDGILTLGLQIPPFVEREDVRRKLLQIYRRKLKAIDHQYEEAGFNPEQIAEYRRSSTNLIEMCQFLAARPIL
jgi:uncharacterized protein YjbI with pentapeptide repeats